MIFSIIRFLLTILELAFIAYWVVPFLYAPIKTQPIYAFLDRIFAPVLAFFRGLIGKHLPAKYMLFDWSYLAVIVVINLLQWLF